MLKNTDLGTWVGMLTLPLASLMNVDKLLIFRCILLFNLFNGYHTQMVQNLPKY